MTVYRIGSVEYRQFPWWNDEANYPMTLKHDINQPDEYEFLLTAPQMEMFKINCILERIWRWKG